MIQNSSCVWMLIQTSVPYSSMHFDTSSFQNMRSSASPYFLDPSWSDPEKIEQREWITTSDSVCVLFLSLWWLIYAFIYIYICVCVSWWMNDFTVKWSDWNDDSHTGNSPQIAANFSYFAVTVVVYHHSAMDDESIAKHRPKRKQTTLQPDWNDEIIQPVWTIPF